MRPGNAVVDPYVEGNKEERSTKKRKRSRRTSRQVQDYNKGKVSMIAEERAAFMRAVCEWNEEKVKPRKERRSAQAICKEINTMYNTNICEATVRRKSSVPNLSMEQCLRRGRKPNLKEGVDMALSTALTTYIQLSAK